MLEFENESFAEIITRLSRNAKSEKPKKWAARFAAIDARLIDLAVEVCRDPKISEHTASLEKDARDKLGRNRAAFARLLKHRRARREKAGDVKGVEWFDGLMEICESFHQTLETVINSPPAHGTREGQIREMIECQVARANAADLGDIPPIPGTVMRELIEWAREQA